MADSGHPPAELHERLLICRTIKLNAGAHGGHRRCCHAQMQKNAQNKPQIARLILCVHTTLQVYCNLFLTFCLKLPTSFEAIGTVHQFICDGVKRPAWRTISTHQPNRNCKIQHKCNAQQYHQKFFHMLFSFCLMFLSTFLLSLYGFGWTVWLSILHKPQKKEHGILILNVPCSFCPLLQRLLSHRSQSFISASSRI